MRQVVSEIRKVLWEKWDPIGVNDMPEAFDEYHGYAGGVYALLMQGAADTKVADHLCQIATDTMGLSRYTGDRLGVVVEALKAIDLKVPSVD